MKMDLSIMNHQQKVQQVLIYSEDSQSVVMKFFGSIFQTMQGSAVKLDFYK